MLLSGWTKPRSGLEQGGWWGGGDTKYAPTTRVFFFSILYPRVRTCLRVILVSRRLTGFCVLRSRTETGDGVCTEVQTPGGTVAL